MKPQDFVDKYLPFAKETEEKTGISAIAILAQAALESGWGDKCPGNMMFGVKANKDTPIDKKQLVVTTEYLSDMNGKFPEVLTIVKVAKDRYKYRVKDWFRCYDNPEESFTDHANFFLENPRYAKALEVRGDHNKFIDEIAAAGYATDPTYAETLKQVAYSITKRLPK